MTARGIAVRLEEFERRFDDLIKTLRHRLDLAAEEADREGYGRATYRRGRAEGKLIACAEAVVLARMARDGETIWPGYKRELDASLERIRARQERRRS